MLYLQEGEKMGEWKGTSNHLWLIPILEAAVFSISGWWQTSPYPFAVEGQAAGMSSPDLV